MSRSEPQWKFREMSRGEMNADPIEGEFFSIDHLGSLTDALVRETIQNSLDAGISGEQVLVRFRIAENGDHASLGTYLSSLQPHLNANQNGLIDRPTLQEPVTFIVIEDYGTRGLEGDCTQDDDLGQDSSKNDFFYFWRNVGRSGKSQGDRGRWGLGKTVFQAASRINSFWGATVRRRNPEMLLMGQSVLKTHMIGNRKHYPYGWYGIFDGDFALPARGVHAERFCRDFGIDRENKPGLSIVLLYPDVSITAKAIIGSVLIHYFFPLLSGNLAVEVMANGKSSFIYRDLMEKFISSIDFKKTRMTQENFRALFELSNWALHLKKEDFVELKLPDPKKPPEWSPSLFDPDSLEILKNRFEEGTRIAIRVPLQIQPKGRHHHQTFFNVFMERDPGLEIAEDHFIREGITLAGVKSLKQKGVRMIVSVDDKALSTFLGDSENPAHTEWQERSPKFKDRYVRGPSCLRFVKNSPREIVNILSKPAKGKDRNLLRNILYVDTRSFEGPREPDTGTKPGEHPGESVPSGEPDSHQSFFIFSVRRGFRITRKKGREVPPGRYLIVVAYAIRKGNPFAKYSPFDFEVDKEPIVIETKDLRLSRLQRNEITVETEGPGFSIEVTGFDPHRDLVVRIDKSEAEEP